MLHARARIARGRPESFFGVLRPMLVWSTDDLLQGQPGSLFVGRARPGIRLCGEPVWPLRLVRDKQLRQYRASGCIP